MAVNITQTKMNELVPPTPNVANMVYQQQKIRQFFQESGKAIVTTNNPMFNRSQQYHDTMKWLFQVEEQKYFKETYERMYERIPFCQRSVDIMSDWVMQSGFKIKAPDHLISEDKSQDDVPQLKENIILLRKWIRASSFVKQLGLGIKYLMIYGDSFFEVVKEGQIPKNISPTHKKLLDLRYPKMSGWKVEQIKPIKPQQMRVIRDQSGTVLAYVQIPPSAPFEEYKFDNSKDKFKQIEVFMKDAKDKGYIWFAPEEIIHLKWNPKPSEAYGNSPLEAMKDGIAVLLGMFEDIGIIVRNYAGPTFFFRVGTDDIPATPETLEYIRSELVADVMSNAHIITSSLVQAEVLSAGKATMDLEGYFQIALSYVLLGFGVPEILMGQGKSTTEATAKTQLEAFSRLIKTIQGYIRSEIEMKLFPQICGVEEITPETIDYIPELHWNPIESEEEYRIRLENLFRFGLTTREETRKDLGYQPKPEGELVLDQDKEFQKDMELLGVISGADNEGGDGDSKSGTVRSKGGKDTATKPQQKRSDRDAEKNNKSKTPK